MLFQLFHVSYTFRLLQVFIILVINGYAALETKLCVAVFCFPLFWRLAVYCVCEYKYMILIFGIHIFISKAEMLK